MKKKILVLALAALFLISSPAWCQQLKIGIVDLQQVLEQSEPGKQAMEKLEKDFQDMKSKLDKKKSMLDKMREEIQKQSMMLSEEAQVDKESEYKQKVREFQEMYKNYQKKMQSKEQKLRDPIINKLVDIIQDYGEKNNYTLIMDKKSSGIVYNTEAIELTSKIIARLNNVWKKEHSEN